ncbi:HTH-type transcriptional repressor YcnK [Desulfuromonas sp. DDH964]|uniref:DeoR family transcriptional regulator n=1 Tax=Desulfuromonas sp. DDH964 TaxID=1823759 RepID=UPI00078CC0BC|nr:DeoR family transcriptional regulator [Desulfuromonas sp. DDH964]AMV72861.1 HTH-type transcriptional repressor YcnK [Desulfuromonas sp. DDH964]
MRSTQRRKEILALLKARGGISVGEIAERFGVSKMTGHRDLEQLEQRGAIRRIFGGAVPVAEHSPLGGSMAGELAAARVCTVCRRPPPANLVYTITLTSGEQRFACCPHCGISAQLVLRDQVSLAMCVDYLSGHPNPALDSYFLLGSSAAPCCHPSLLTFSDLEVARRFQTGFGGSLGRMDDAMEFLQRAMGAGSGCPNCGPGRSS